MFDSILSIFRPSVLSNANPRPAVVRHLRLNDPVIHIATDSGARTSRFGRVTGIERVGNDRLLTVSLSGGETLHKLHEKEFVLARRVS